VTLDHEDIEQIARRVAQLLREAPAVRLIDASTVAEMLGVERDWVYAHAQDLGAVRLGSPRGRVRFDVRELDRAVAPARSPDVAAARQPTTPRRTDQRIELLPFEK
jgi:hypothetical protein